VFIVLLVAVAALVAALVWAVTLQRALRSARREVTELGTELAASRTESEAARADATAARAEVAVARAETEAAHNEAQRERERAEQSERAVAELTQRVADLGEWAAAVLAVEIRRVDRLWRERLSLPGEPSPLEQFDDPAAASARIFAELSREDRGVVVDVTWDLEPMPTPELALAVMKVVEELIAAAALANGGTLHARGSGAEIAICLAPEPPIDPPAALTSALASMGWALRRDGDDLVAEPV
jgi:hypothetical protein